MFFDASGLEPTSSKKDFPWRSRRVALIRIGGDGVVEQAGLLAEKRALVERCDGASCVLAVRILQYEPAVLRVDELSTAEASLQQG